MAGTCPSGLSVQWDFINSELVWTWQDPSISGKSKSFMSSCHSLRASAVSYVTVFVSLPEGECSRLLDWTFPPSLSPLYAASDCVSLIIKCQNSWPLQRFALFWVLDIVKESFSMETNIFFCLALTFFNLMKPQWKTFIFLFFYFNDVVLFCLKVVTHGKLFQVEVSANELHKLFRTSLAIT